MVELDCPQMTT